MNTCMERCFKREFNILIPLTWNDVWEESKPAQNQIVQTWLYWCWQIATVAWDGGSAALSYQLTGTGRKLAVLEWGRWMDEVAEGWNNLYSCWSTVNILKDMTCSGWHQPLHAHLAAQVGAVDLQPGCLYGAFSSTPDAWQTLIAVCHPLPAERPLRFMWHKLNHLKVKILPDSQPCSGYIVEEAESSFLQGEVTENGVFSLFPDASSVDMHRAAARPG